MISILDLFLVCNRKVILFQLLTRKFALGDQISVKVISAKESPREMDIIDTRHQKSDPIK